MMKHRGDIDGLRALAILPVLLFHFEFRAVQGGYLGVDVFFVISGFLITKLINDEITAHTFSIKRFYERRVRRIFPALFAVMATLLVVGYGVFLPTEFEDLGKSIVATTLFVSNFYFYSSDSYFGPVSQHEPLLHTWSLAVEEQFYLVLPLALLLLRRGGSRFTVTILRCSAIGSLLVSFVLLRSNPTAAFFLPIPRAWELLCGALLALESYAFVSNRVIRELLGGVGLLLVAFAFVLCPSGEESRFPLALYPCLGAGLLIAAGSSGGCLVSRWLANPVLTYIGRISYSLYLWHWPCLIVYKLTVKDSPALGDKLILLVASITLAALSERFVERPFRKYGGSERRPLIPVLGSAAIAMATSVVIGLTLIGNQGFAGRYPADVDKLAAFIQYGAPKAFRSGTCFLEPNESASFQSFPINECLATNAGRKNFLLLGDSHAAHLWFGLSRVYPDINFMQATVASCPPLLNPPKEWLVQRTRTCREMMQFIFHDYLTTHRLDGVIIAARWPETSASAVEQTVKYVRKYDDNVFVVGRIVEYSEPLPRILAISKLRRDPDLVKKKRIRSLFGLDKEIERSTEAAGGHYISMDRTLCRAGDCQTVTDTGVPLQFDYGHLTADGSREVAQDWKMAGEFENLALISPGRANRIRP